MKMAEIKHSYDFLFTDLADPRIKNWFLMSDPVGILCILGLYMYGVYVYFPRYMENRKAYHLKKVIAMYNVFQIIACTLLIYGIATSGWTTYYNFSCQPPDYSQNKLAMQMLSMCWWTLMLKIVELVETIFFILRKKQNQVSKLHVYHHTSTIMLGWISCKYIGGGMVTMVIMVNSFVHILMYTYYLLSSLGPNMQQKLQKWKPRLTMIQMIQFISFVAYAANTLRINCNIPKVLILIFLPNVFMLMGMFWNFYKVNYIHKVKKYHQKIQ